MFRKFFLLMDEAKPDAGGAGGGGGNPAPKPSDEITTLKAQNDALMKRLEALEKGGGQHPPKPDDSDLATRAAKERADGERKASDQKAIESALSFTLGSKDWLKTNETLLPKTVSGIFEQAEKEKYGSAIEKANEIKAGIVSEFFSLQANLDLLTPGQKNLFEDFSKLTKNGKQEKVESIFLTVFEPAFEMLKRVKKAEALSKGYANPSDTEAAYKAKLMKVSKTHYLGDK